MTGRELINKARRDATMSGCFLHANDVATIASDPATRLTMLLVRCGNGRFLAPAQDVAHFIAAIEASKLDYVRDVSLPAGR